MADYTVAAARATGAAGSNSVSLTALDLTFVKQGMSIYFGSSGRKTGDGWRIATVSPTGTSGGSVTLVDSLSSAVNAAPFVIDTGDYAGSASALVAAYAVAVINALLTLTGAGTSVTAGSKQVALDKANSGAIGRLLYAIGGRNWFEIGQRAIAIAGATVEALALRAFPDGTSGVDALTVNGSTGAVDFLTEDSSAASATITDIGAGNTRRVVITGTTTITGFASRKNSERILFFNESLTLTHNPPALVLPGGVNIVTSPRDVCMAVSDASGNWRVHSYTPAADASGVLVTTPIPTPATGAFSSASATVRARRFGAKMAHVAVDVTIPNNGSGGGSVVVPLPFQAVGASHYLTGREIGATGKVLHGIVSAGATALTIYNVDNTYPGGSGYRLTLSGSYEVA